MENSQVVEEVILDEEPDIVVVEKSARADRDRDVEEDESSWEEDDDEIYEVETILRDRVRGGVKEFLVKWKGYDSEHNTWEPLHNLNCEELIEEFQRQKQNRKGVVSKRRSDPEPEEEEEEEEEDDEDDYEPASPPPKKRAKGGTGGGKGTKRKPTGRGRRCASDKEPEQTVVRCKTIFKKHIIQNCLKAEDKRNPEDDSSPDMVVKYFMKYDIDSGEVLVGSGCKWIRVDVDEVEKLLKCSACDKTFGNMGVWRMIQKMKHHVVGGFTCYLCNEPYSFHTKGANHFYHHMGKFHPRCGKPGRKQGRNRKFDDEEEISVDDTVSGGVDESDEDGSQISNNEGGTEEATHADPT